MKKSVFMFVFISCLCGLAKADQTVLSCNLDLASVYSVKIKRGSSGYYAEIINEYSKKSVAPVSAEEVKEKSYDIPTLKKTRLQLKYFATGWMSREVFSKTYKVTAIAECR